MPDLSGRSAGTTHLLYVAVKTEEVEDAAAVHLGGMEAAHHGNRAGGGVA